MTAEHPVNRPTTESKAPKSVSQRKQPDAKASRPKPVGEIRSKADLIRKVAEIIKAKGEDPRPTEIVKILADEGVSVAAAQVSMTLKAAGYRPLRSRRKGEKPATIAAAGRPAAAGRSKRISIDDLLAAKKAVAELGGADRALAVIQALRRLDG